MIQKGIPFRDAYVQIGEAINKGYTSNSGIIYSLLITMILLNEATIPLIKEELSP